MKLESLAKVSLVGSLKGSALIAVLILNEFIRTIKIGEIYKIEITEKKNVISPFLKDLLILKLNLLTSS